MPGLRLSVEDLFVKRKPVWSSYLPIKITEADGFKTFGAISLSILSGNLGFSLYFEHCFKNLSLTCFNPMEL